MVQHFVVIFVQETQLNFVTFLLRFDIQRLLQRKMHVLKLTWSLLSKATLRLNPHYSQTTLCIHNNNNNYYCYCTL